MSPRDIWEAVDSKKETAVEVEAASRNAARALGCSGDSDEFIMRCLQARSLEQIIDVYTVGNITFA